MEIARIQIVADENFLRKEALRREANTCSECGTVVTFEIRRLEELVHETAKCSCCGHQSESEHSLQ